MADHAQTDVVTLGKLVTLHPVPIAATWSVVTIGKDAMFGPTDTTLWAIVRYSEADFATISHALKADDALRPAKVSAPPDWLATTVDLARFRRGSDYVFEGPVSAGRPFASSMYDSGFAMILPDHRVMIQFSSQ